MKAKDVIWLITFVVISLMLGTLPFIIYFKNQPFSKNLNDWADAATWFSLFISIITAGFLGYLSWRIHKNEIDSQNKQINLLRGIEKPVLTFYCENDKLPKNIDNWFVKNIGKGPALNISICHYKLDAQEWDKELVDCYSIGINENPLQLSWLNNIKCEAILAFYQDSISKDFYCSLAHRDQTLTIDLKENFEYYYIDKEILSNKIVERILSQSHLRKMQAIQNTTLPVQDSFI